MYKKQVILFKIKISELLYSAQINMNNTLLQKIISKTVMKV
jgi:hypothetical protein